MSALTRQMWIIVITLLSAQAARGQTPSLAIIMRFGARQARPFYTALTNDAGPTAPSRPGSPSFTTDTETSIRSS